MSMEKDEYPKYMLMFPHQVFRKVMTIHHMYVKKSLRMEN